MAGKVNHERRRRPAQYPCQFVIMVSEDVDEVVRARAVELNLSLAEVLRRAIAGGIGKVKRSTR